MSQPDVHSLNSRLGLVLFEDGVLGQITNWIDQAGESHTAFVEDAVAVVARHPGPVSHPWYAIGLSDFGPAIIH